MTEDQDKKKSDISRSLNSFQKIIRQSGPAATASYGLIASILIFTYAGWYIDELNDSSPMAIIAGLFIGMVIGFYHLIKAMRTNKY